MSEGSAERIESPGGRQYHIGLAPGDVAPWILLVGDPARADRISGRMTTRRLTASHREFRTHTGVLGGREISVMATGMGADNTEIAVVELLACCPRPTFLRVGSSGALQPGIPVGDVVISTGSVRLESTTLGFVEPGYPALAHHEAILALVSAAEALGAPYHLGLTATAAGFYGWQGRRGNALPPRDPDLTERLARQGVLNFEMEASALFTLATLAGVRAGCICAVFANRPRNEFIAPECREAAEDLAIGIALGALDVLVRMDATAGGRPFHLKPRSAGVPGLPGNSGLDLQDPVG